jgi:hypothetical protein
MIIQRLTDNIGKNIEKTKEKIALKTNIKSPDALTSAHTYSALA